MSAFVKFMVEQASTADDAIKSLIEYCEDRHNEIDAKIDMKRDRSAKFADEGKMRAFHELAVKLRSIQNMRKENKEIALQENVIRDSLQANS